MMSNAITNYMVRFVRLECGDSVQCKSSVTSLCRRVRYQVIAGASRESCRLIVKFTGMARELDELTCKGSTSRPKVSVAHTYNRLPEDEPSGSKHVADIMENKILVYNKCILFVYIV
jgi:hypothetical protein